MGDSLRRARHNPGRSYLADAEILVEPERWGEIVARVAAASADLHRAAKRPRAIGSIQVSGGVAL